MKKKLALFTVLAVLFGVFFVISGKEAVRVQAAEGGVRIVEIWGNKAHPQQIASPGIDETFGYVWAVRQDNGRYYVYYAKERGGKGRYLFQTQPDVTPEGIVFTDSDVYFTQDSADGLKHYAYQVNLSGTRKMTRLFGFKSKTAAKSSILNYYDGRIFYYYEDKETGIGSLYRYDTATKTKKGCKANTVFENIFGQYLYMKDVDAETVRIFDCAQNKIIKKINAPSGFALDSIGPFPMEESFQTAISYMQRNFENDKMMVSFKVYIANADGSGLKLLVEHKGENASFMSTSPGGALFLIEETTDNGGRTSRYDFVTSAGEITSFDSLSDYYEWRNSKG